MDLSAINLCDEIVIPENAVIPENCTQIVHGNLKAAFRIQLILTSHEEDLGCYEK